MPDNRTKKKFKQKTRSCPMCKPHKMHWDDKRTRQDVKKDIDTKQQVEDAMMI